MTKVEFLIKYHSYIVDTKEKAVKEIENMEPVTDYKGKIIFVEAVYFPNKAHRCWAIMLKDSASAVREMGLIE